MDNRTENRNVSGSMARRAGEIALLVVVSAAVGVVFGFVSQSAVIGVIVGAGVAIIAAAWTWRARRSGGYDEETRATTRQAGDERRSHPEYGPLSQPGTFGVRIGTGAAGKDNGRG
ncbi:hypothetical protein [Microbacterium sp. cx-59]|uniref:hypothetical protein n=1 Tax=Microbacterium sp. cx-59 TaxID=2891207 RepID=UPI001E3EB406|nr:hypothetical protein [Microbacterium sp. cx-59]MCC4908270.1 hypothetical protein [Microbacterium sp. cx-59]